MPREPEGGAPHAWRAKWLSVKLIDPCRIVARQHGYALTEHGSRNRDIDWVAVAWVQDCGSPTALIDSLVRKIGEINNEMNWCRPFHNKVGEHYTQARRDYDMAGCPGVKPHGRLGWTIHLGGGPYIDLSVIPPILAK